MTVNGVLLAIVSCSLILMKRASSLDVQRA
jgi:hypothetical protein